jgi:CHAT domain-containing protein
MVRFIFLVICCYPFAFIFSQQKALEKDLENCKDDVCRAAIYQRLAKSYIPLKDYDKSCFYFEKELALRQNMADTGQLAIEKSKNYFNLVSLLKQTGNYDRAEKIALASITFNRNFFGEEANETADAYKQYGQICILMKMSVPMNWALEKALKIRKNEKNPDASKIIELLILQSDGLDETGDPETAETIIYDALAIYKKYKLNDEMIFARIQLSLGHFAGLNGRLADAIVYTKKSLEIRLKAGINQVQVANCYGNLGVYYLKLKQNRTAVNHFEECMKILIGLLGENHPSVIESKSNLAAAYIETGDFDKAKKILSGNLIVKRKESYFLTLWQMADIEKKLKNSSGAIYYYKAVENELLKIYGTNHPKLAELDLDFGIFYKSIGEIEKAKEKLESSLKSNRIYNRVSDPLLYLGAVTQLLYLKNSVENSFIAQCNFQIEKIWNNCRRDADYRVAMEKIRNFYEALLLNIYNNSSSEKLPENLLLNCFESIKSLQLLSSLSETEKLRKAKVPDALINEFKNLKNETIYFEQQWLDAEFISDKPQSIKYRKLFEEKEAQYLKLKSTIESRYNVWVNKAVDDRFSDQLRTKISEKELFLHYFVGEQHSFLLAFNSKKMSLKKIDNDLVEKVQVFISTLLNVEGLDENLQHSYNNLSKATSLISKALLPEKAIFNGIDKITVIPDASLFYIPFEILYYKEPDKTNLSFAAQPFLLRKYAIRYAYSLQVLSKQKSYKNSLHLTALAPHYDSKINSIQELRTNAELKNLSDIYSGIFYSNKKISKSDLLKIFAQKPDILHLAMHAAAPDSSGAYFTLSNAERLEMFEISGINLDNTALIVLSACETGLGLQTRGEGLMSLGRAFAYSGAAAVVNTLWPLHDHSAVELMRLFYANLDKGMTKSEALRKAKLEFLDKAGTMQAHPFFWAAPVLWGNDEPIKLQKKSNLLTTLSIGASIFLIVLLLYKFRKRLKINKNGQDIAA